MYLQKHFEIFFLGEEIMRNGNKHKRFHWLSFYYTELPYDVQLERLK